MNANGKRNAVKVGSRKSQLAVIQTESVVQQLQEITPDTVFEIETMLTTGDNILDKALSKIGEKALFTKELEIALEEKRVDFVVHSLKDLPTTLPSGMVIGAVCKREDPHDAVIMSNKHQQYSLKTLPEGSVIGTSSLRRIAQLTRLHSHLKFQDVRGNLNTRLRKLDEGETYTALILATAGVKRMGWENRISHKLHPDDCLYAVGQGALAVECRENDNDLLELLSPLHDESTVLCCIAERSFMKTLEGGCSVPIAVCSEYKNGKLKLRGGVFSLNGSEAIMESIEKSCEREENGTNSPAKKKIRVEQNVRSYAGIVAKKLDAKLLQTAEEAGVELAKTLLGMGAEDILRKARKDNEASRD